MCFGEVFWDDLLDRPPAERWIDPGHVQARVLHEVSILWGLKFVDTTDDATLSVLSAHRGTFLGDYESCQTWCAALQRHPSGPDGLLYASARKAGRCLAIFATGPRVRAGEWRRQHRARGTPLPDCPQLAGLLRRHGYAGGRGG